MSYNAGGSAKSCALTGYLKFLLFAYILTAPFLLEKSGVTGDDGKRAVATAAACLLGALGLGIVIYDRDRDASARALGALLILSWLCTVIVIWRQKPPPSSLSRESWLIEGLSVSDSGTAGSPEIASAPRAPPPPAAESQAPEPPVGHGAPASWGAPAAPPGPREPMPEWAAGDLGDGLSPEGLGRIFGAPNLKDFMKPSPSGFVTPEDLEEIQSGAVGQPGSGLQAFVPLGAGSYSAQGVIFGSDVCGAHGSG